MPRERIPQNKLLRSDAQSQQRAPDNRRRGFGKTIRTFPRLASPTRLDSQKNVFRHDVSFSSKQNSLGSHRDSAEMTAAVTKRFPDHRKLPFAEPFSKIPTYLFPANTGRIPADIV